MEIQKFTIDRKTWLRGEGKTYSYLLRRSDNKRCCLGQIAQQCGISDEDLLGVTCLGTRFLYPQNLKTPEFLLDGGRNSQEAVELMIANDDIGISDEKRERKIKEGFKKHGFEVEFIN